MQNNSLGISGTLEDSILLFDRKKGVYAFANDSLSLIEYSSLDSSPTIRFSNYFKDSKNRHWLSDNHKILMTKGFYDPNPFDVTPLLCLLYTSPSPRDLSTSRMPSSA